MFCPNCGNQCEASNFCPNCGQSLCVPGEMSDEAITKYIQMLEAEEVGSKVVHEEFSQEFDLDRILDGVDLTPPDKLDEKYSKEKVCRSIHRAYCPRCSSNRFRVRYDSNSIMRRHLLNRNEFTRLFAIILNLYEIFHRTEIYICVDCGYTWKKQ